MSEGGWPEVAVTELTLRERRYLEKRHPEIAGHRSAVVVAVDDAGETLSLAKAVLEGLIRYEHQMRRTIEAISPPLAGLSEAVVLQARRNAEARAALLADFGALTSSEVADLAGSRAENRAALANRWRQEGRIFAVTYEGNLLFPAFQLDDDGRPRAVIAAVLEAFGQGSGEWETALWFTSANGWLGGARPVDLLDREPQRVIDAARSEASELVF